MPTSPFATPHTRTAALLTRNALATSLFVYAVLTTRIYCRPDCPSRLARLANIRFYDTAAEAAAAGFRPCKRCTPERERGRSGQEGGRRRQEEVVERGCEGTEGDVQVAVDVDVEEGMDEVDWEEWVDYSACSTPVLVPLTFPHLN